MKVKNVKNKINNTILTIVNNVNLFLMLNMLVSPVIRLTLSCYLILKNVLLQNENR